MLALPRSGLRCSELVQYATPTRSACGIATRLLANCFIVEVTSEDSLDQNARCLCQDERIDVAVSDFEKYWRVRDKELVTTNWGEPVSRQAASNWDKRAHSSLA